MRVEALTGVIDAACIPPQEGEPCWTWDFSPLTGNPQHRLSRLIEAPPPDTAAARAVVFQDADTVILIVGWLEDHVA